MIIGIYRLYAYERIEIYFLYRVERFMNLFYNLTVHTRVYFYVSTYTRAESLYRRVQLFRVKILHYVGADRFSTNISFVNNVVYQQVKSPAPPLQERIENIFIFSRTTQKTIRFWTVIIVVADHREKNTRRRRKRDTLSARLGI